MSAGSKILLNVTCIRGNSRHPPGQATGNVRWNVSQARNPKQTHKINIEQITEIKNVFSTVDVLSKAVIISFNLIVHLEHIPMSRNDKIWLASHKLSASFQNRLIICGFLMQKWCLFKYFVSKKEEVASQCHSAHSRDISNNESCRFYCMTRCWNHFHIWAIAYQKSLSSLQRASSKSGKKLQLKLFP